MMDGIWIGGDYIPCHKVTTYFCSFSRDGYYYGNGSTRFHKTVPSWDKDSKIFEPMKHTAPVILAFWSEE